MTADPRPPNTGSLRGFVDALQLQGIVIGAVMMREIHTRYGREISAFYG